MQPSWPTVAFLAASAPTVIVAVVANLMALIVFYKKAVFRKILSNRWDGIEKEYQAHGHFRAGESSERKGKGIFKDIPDICLKQINK